jgi:ferrous iron transport protein B
VVVLADASNLARNLYLVLQILDLGVPTVLALNLMDAAARSGLVTNVQRLAQELGIPVVPTIASRAVGTQRLMSTAVDCPARPATPHYGREIEAAVRAVQRALPACAAPRSEALLLLEGDQLTAQSYPAAAAVAEARASALGDEGEVPRVVAERHRLAGRLAASTQYARHSPPSDRAWKVTTHPVLGLAVLAGVLGGMVSFLFLVGNALANAFSTAWLALVSPLIQAPIHALFGYGAFARTLLWGFDAGIQAALSVGVPYVLTFYFLLALLEDSGYLNAAAFLADRTMNRLGLHGRAVIPLVAGFGCSVPAIIGTRVLSSRRERTIASLLITMVPCSARTAVIAGAVARYVGWGPAVALFAVDLLLAGAAGRGLNALLPGKPSGLVLEVFPFRPPVLRHVARKTWQRFRGFIVMATPIMIAGSLVLGALYETDFIWKLTGPFSPIVQGWLLLPPVAGLALVFGVLRKELSLQLLVTLAVVRYGRGAANLTHFLTGPQIMTYALVNTVYVPCVATIAAMRAELGIRRTAFVSALSLGIALLAGGTLARVLPHL